MLSQGLRGGAGNPGDVGVKALQRDGALLGRGGEGKAREEQEQDEAGAVHGDIGLRGRLAFGRPWGSPTRARAGARSRNLGIARQPGSQPTSSLPGSTGKHVSFPQPPGQERETPQFQGEANPSIPEGMRTFSTSPVLTGDRSGFTAAAEVAGLLRRAGAGEPSGSGAELAVAQNPAPAPWHAAVWQHDLAAAIRLREEGSGPNAAITGRRLVNGEVEGFTPH